MLLDELLPATPEATGVRVLDTAVISATNWAGGKAPQPSPLSTETVGTVSNAMCGTVYAAPDATGAPQDEVFSGVFASEVQTSLRQGYVLSHANKAVAVETEEYAVSFVSQSTKGDVEPYVEVALNLDFSSSPSTDVSVRVAGAFGYASYDVSAAEATNWETRITTDANGYVEISLDAVHLLPTPILVLPLNGSWIAFQSAAAQWIYPSADAHSRMATATPRWVQG